MTTGLPAEVEAVTAAFLTAVDEAFGPGRLLGLHLHGSMGWGEFFPGSDIDFVAVWDTLPAGVELDQLRDVHQRHRAQHAARAFDGFHCTAAHLANDASTLDPLPVFYEGAFHEAGTEDVHIVTWHELATRPVVVRGAAPHVFTNDAALRAYTRENLATYWTGIRDQLRDAGPQRVGAQDDTTAWVVLGAPRLHHVLTTGQLTSKSGAGRYVLERFPSEHHRIAREALCLREAPFEASLYDDPAERGAAVTAVLEWVLDDVTSMP